jgi:hypothetical protein
VFYSPTGLFTEPDGSLICAFSDDYTIYRIRPNGQLQLVLGMLRNRNYHFSEPLEKVPVPEALDTPLNGPTGVVERSDGTFFFIERGPQIVRQYHPAQGIECIFPRSKAKEFFWKDEAPEQAPIDQYHPAFPGALALDAEEDLYMADVRHGCVLKIDLKQGEIRRVIHLDRSAMAGQRSTPGGGCSAIGFGPDGTAWVLDSANGIVQGYRPQSAGQWTLTAESLEEIAGEPLSLPVAGSGIAVGA